MTFELALLDILCGYTRTKVHATYYHLDWLECNYLVSYTLQLTLLSGHSCLIVKVRVQDE